MASRQFLRSFYIFMFSFCILYLIGYGWLNSIWHQCTGWASHWCQDFLETTSGGPFQSLPLQNWLTHWQVEPNFTKLEWNRCGHCSKDHVEWSKIKGLKGKEFHASRKQSRLVIRPDPSFPPDLLYQCHPKTAHLPHIANILDYGNIVVMIFFICAT